MEKFNLEQDIQVFCVDAASFPDGVLLAHQTLHRTIPFSLERKYMGISYSKKEGGIHYKAAASPIGGEDFDLETFTVPRGQYLSVTIKDFMNNTLAIGETFQQLITDPRIDPQGFCPEWYISDNDCRCMVRMADLPTPSIPQ